MDVVAVKPCCDTAVDFEFAETEAFDEIPLSVELFVVPGYWCLRVRLAGITAFILMVRMNAASNLVGIITFVGNHRLGRVSGQQRRGALAVSLLPAGQQQAQGSSQRIAEHMNLRSQSSTGSLPEPAHAPPFSRGSLLMGFDEC